MDIGCDLTDGMKNNYTLSRNKNNNIKKICLSITINYKNSLQYIGMIYMTIAVYYCNWLGIIV